MIEELKNEDFTVSVKELAAAHAVGSMTITQWTIEGRFPMPEKINNPNVCKGFFINRLLITQWGK